MILTPGRWSILPSLIFVRPIALEELKLTDINTHMQIEAKALFSIDLRELKVV